MIGTLMTQVRRIITDFLSVLISSVSGICVSICAKIKVQVSNVVEVCDATMPNRVIKAGNKKDISKKAV